MKFPLAIHQKPTILEIFFITIILAITFTPFIYGIETKQPKFCFSLFVGVILLKLYNIATDNKFTIPKIIQKTKSIGFYENYIEIYENQNLITYKWNELEEIEIEIFAYKGRRIDSDSWRNGIENSINFIKNEQHFEYRFYIEDVHQFKSLKKLFHETILPKLEQLQNLKEIGFLKSQLNFSRNYNNINNDVDYL